MAQFSFLEPRLKPLQVPFVSSLEDNADCKAFAQLEAVKTSWALRRHAPSMLRRHHSSSGFIPYHLAILEPADSAAGGLDAAQDDDAAWWPDTDDELDFSCGQPARPTMSLTNDESISRSDEGSDSEEPPASGTMSLGADVDDEVDTGLGSGEEDTDEGCSLDGASEGNLPRQPKEQPGNSTLMLRNLPQGLTQQELVEGMDASGFSGLYDFVYLPVCFKSREGKGYAFVNFSSVGAAGALVGAWHGSRRFAGVGATAPLNISPALVQGLDANLKKWGRMSRVRDPSLRPFIRSSTDGSANSEDALAPAPGAVQSSGSTLGTRPRLPASSFGAAGEPDAAPGAGAWAAHGEALLATTSPMSSSASMVAVQQHHSTAMPPSQEQQPQPGQQLPAKLSLADALHVGGSSAFVVPLPAEASPVSSPQHAAATAAECGERDQADGVTTMMVRNVPKNVTQKELIAALEQSGFTDMFDFVYMPCSFVDKENKGYAFVNFSYPAVASAFAGAWHGSSRFFAGNGEAKGATCEEEDDMPLSITPAAVQGLEANTAQWAGPRMKRIRNPDLRPFVRPAYQLSPSLIPVAMAQSCGRFGAVVMEPQKPQRQPQPPTHTQDFSAPAGAALFAVHTENGQAVRFAMPQQPAIMKEASSGMQFVPSPSMVFAVSAPVASVDRVCVAGMAADPWSQCHWA